jgi:hypothetical protein
VHAGVSEPLIQRSQVETAADQVLCVGEIAMAVLVEFDMKIGTGDGVEAHAPRVRVAVVVELNRRDERGFVVRAASWLADQCALGQCVLGANSDHESSR